MGGRERQRRAKKVTGWWVAVHAQHITGHRGSSRSARVIRAPAGGSDRTSHPLMQGLLRLCCRAATDEKSDDCLAVGRRTCTVFLHLRGAL